MVVYNPGAACLDAEDLDIASVCNDVAVHPHHIAVATL